MNAPARRPLRLGVLLALGLLAAGLGACRGDARRGGRGAADPDATGADPAAGAGAEGGTISLSNQDLAPMDGYIRRRFWVLGDDVEIVASKEYFIQNLSISARIGFVRRDDKEGENEAVSTLTFLGKPGEVDFSNAPRVLVGTGISVLARRTLTIRFTRTTSPDLPVRIRIAANGDARMGMGNQVSRRDPSIVLGAQLRRVGGAYVFEEQ
ncbi:MAG: hypothetical protein JNM10_07530 [Planctomycetia bacterium]|nr:hypothetical protein [Planctomycetia bacterium]